MKLISIEREDHSRHPSPVYQLCWQEGWSLVNYRDKGSQHANDNNQFSAIAQLFMEDGDALINKIEAFPKYVSRQSFAKVLAKYEIFKRILPVHGSIVECGVLNGAGLMTWAKLSSIFEPVNHVRRIIGFDTFSGFPSVSEEDTRTGTFHAMQAGQMAGSSIEDIEKAIHVYDLNRPLR
ncbi:MAG: hypothetical protein G8345_21950, partial [Magnetococcales bacterium]|nr:hypothetical protein [Magnetococcales bacterium]